MSEIRYGQNPHGLDSVLVDFWYEAGRDLPFFNSYPFIHEPVAVVAARQHQSVLQSTSIVHPLALLATFDAGVWTAFVLFVIVLYGLRRIYGDSKSLLLLLALVFGLLENLYENTFMAGLMLPSTPLIIDNIDTLLKGIESHRVTWAAVSQLLSLRLARCSTNLEGVALTREFL